MATGFSFGPSGDVIGMAEIKGEIKDGALALADRTLPALEAAFKSNCVKQIVLKIDRPSGAAVEAGRIVSTLVTYKQKYAKPVTAVTGNSGASRSVHGSHARGSHCCGRAQPGWIDQSNSHTLATDKKSPN